MACCVYCARPARRHRMCGACHSAYIDGFSDGGGARWMDSPDAAVRRRAHLVIRKDAFEELMGA